MPSVRPTAQRLPVVPVSRPATVPRMAGSPARSLGRILAVVMGVLLQLRGPRPIHTTGVLLEGSVTWRQETAARSGIAWIDERGPDTPPAVVARFSRGASLPSALLAASPTRSLGRALAGVMGVLLQVRGPRPIHTTGVLLEGRVTWRPEAAARSGIAWIDERGPDTPPTVVAPVLPRRLAARGAARRARARAAVPEPSAARSTCCSRRPASASPAASCWRPTARRAARGSRR